MALQIELEKTEAEFAFAKDQLSKAKASGDRQWVKRATKAFAEAHKRQAVAAVVRKPTWASG